MSSIIAPTAQIPSDFTSSTPTSAGACPQKPSICTCTTPADQTFTQPIIGCANKKCRPRYYHLRCVGLYLHPANQFTWLCPTCAPDAPLPARICDCEDPPYRTGPMVECAQQELCTTRWFHLPCTGLCPGEETTGWTCAPCSVAIVMRQDYEEELERRRANGEVVEGDEAVVVPPAPAGVTAEEEEAEQREYVSDGVPGVFLREEDAPRAVSASPLKRKSDDDEDDTPPVRKKNKRASLSPPPPPSPSPEPEPEYCVCGTPGTDDMIACYAPNCHAEWFHFDCVGLRAETVPDGEWFCEECAGEMEEAKKNKKKKKGGKGRGRGKR